MVCVCLPLGKIVFVFLKETGKVTKNYIKIFFSEKGTSNLVLTAQGSGTEGNICSPLILSSDEQIPPFHLFLCHGLEGFYRKEFLPSFSAPLGVMKTTFSFLSCP